MKKQRMQQKPIPIQKAWDALITSGKYPLFDWLINVNNRGLGKQEFMENMPDELLKNYCNRGEEDYKDLMGEDVLVTMHHKRCFRKKSLRVSSTTEDIYKDLQEFCLDCAAEVFRRAGLISMKYDKKNIWGKDCYMIRNFEPAKDGKGWEIEPGKFDVTILSKYGVAFPTGENHD